MLTNVVAMILAGGEGKRLHPLTRDRAKPAVPFGGRYRLIDFVLSNFVNSGVNKISVLTQYKAGSLMQHLARGWQLAPQLGHYVAPVPATMNLGPRWFQGSADAVFQNLDVIENEAPPYVCVFGADHIYKMDVRQMIRFHADAGADATVAVIRVPAEDMSQFGIVECDAHMRVTGFLEKPPVPPGASGTRLASMGLYVFNRDVLFSLLHEENRDFGKHVIPQALGSHRVYAYVFQGAWEDIGTISNYFECSLELTSALPRFNLFDMSTPLFTRPRFLPSSRINSGAIRRSLLADGCILDDATVEDSILGLRSVLSSGARLHRAIMMGSDYYESDDSVAKHMSRGEPRIGIGRNTSIDHAIIDKNARIGENCVISPANKPSDSDHPLYYIRDGIVIIPKDGIVPNGTVI